MTKQLIFMESKWIVHDRYGNEIYLTRERWQYILRYHPQLDGLHDELLDTLRKGRRQQQPDDPVRYKYYHYSAHLPPEYNTIVVVVKFTTQLQTDGTLVVNNFVITAWATYIFREG
ncbi:MAG: hypothetical protein R3E79_40355 [Caldilineaceae bacterium]